MVYPASLTEAIKPDGRSGNTAVTPTTYNLPTPAAQATHSVVPKNTLSKSAEPGMSPVNSTGKKLRRDAGALLLREIEEQCGIIKQLAHCFSDWRNQDYVAHSVEKMLRQRIFGLSPATETSTNTTRCDETHAWRSPVANRNLLHRGTQNSSARNL